MIVFLENLDKEQQSYFLELAHYVATIDHDLAIQEETLINAYKTEMHMTEYEPRNLPLDEILNVFTGSTIQKIVFLEILGLISIDLEWNVAEQQCLQQIRQRFAVSEQFYHQAIDWVQKAIELYTEGKQLVYNE
jgi:hypothetical protein